MSARGASDERRLSVTHLGNPSGKRVEEIFGWTKTVGNFRKTRYKGFARTQLSSYLVGAALLSNHLQAAPSQTPLQQSAFSTQGSADGMQAQTFPGPQLPLQQ